VMLMLQSNRDIIWQAGRNRFSHDWLKNKFSLTLERAVKIAQERIEDDEFAARFIEKVLPEFESEIEQAKELIESFENSMSPRVLLDREPLSRLEDCHRDWLGVVVHALWKSRIGADELICAATERLQDALAACDRLKECMRDKCTKLEGPLLVCCCSELLTFRDAVGELGAAISKFPNRIRIV
jgi:hypothetical protein